MAVGILVDLERCVGCWTCSMACKMGWSLEDEEYRLFVRTLGSGAGIDRPQGVYPDLKMSWQPIYQKSCTFCAPRVADGDKPFCSCSCPTNAISFGDPADENSDIAKEMKRCKDMKYRIFEMPAYEGSKANISYATKA